MKNNIDRLLEDLNNGMENIKSIQNNLKVRFFSTLEFGIFDE